MELFRHIHRTLSLPPYNGLIRKENQQSKRQQSQKRAKVPKHYSVQAQQKLEKDQRDHCTPGVRPMPAMHGRDSVAKEVSKIQALDSTQEMVSAQYIPMETTFFFLNHALQYKLRAKSNSRSIPCSV